MKIIILGGGSIGGSVAKELSSEENDVVVIDNNDENLEPIKSVEGIQTLHGNGSSPKMLSKAGLDDSSLLLCLTDSEETNLLASLIGKEKFNAGRIVCRLKGSEYEKFIICINYYFISAVMCSNGWYRWYGFSRGCIKRKRIRHVNK